MTYVIGCDLGSQSAKAVLMAPDGTIAATACKSYSMIHPRSGWADQDPADYRTAIAYSVRSVVEQAGIDPADVTHIGLSSQVDGVVAIDDKHQPLRPAIIWLDRRATKQVGLLAKAVGATPLFTKTGLNLDASHTAPKYMWLRDEEPDTYAAAASLPSVGGYAVAWLTGRSIQDHANSSSSLLYDVTARAWSDELIAAAAELGLSTSCLVLVSTGDDHACCVGAGGVRPGVVIDILGTAEPVGVASDRPVFDDTRLVETHAHATPGGYLLENPGFVSGGNTLWFAKNVLGVDQQEFFALAERSVPGANGVRFLPALSGAMAPRWNDRMRGSFSGLGMNHDRADLARAIIEGNAFAFRAVYDRLAAMGLADSVRSVGGGARSTLWLTAKATLCRTPINRIKASETSAAGGAMLAAVAAGFFPDLEAAVDATVELHTTAVEPDLSAQAAYDDAYHDYLSLFDAFEHLAT